MRNDEQRACVLTAAFVAVMIAAMLAHSMIAILVATSTFTIILTMSAQKSRIERRLRRYQHDADRRINHEMEDR